MATMAHESAQVPDDVTICITSCGRIDLLEQTLASFQRYNKGGRYLLSEDSTDSDVIETITNRYPEMKVLSGNERLGLMGSIDRLYSVVETSYIFHLEDDWAFEGPVQWDAAKEILSARKDVANVSVRMFGEIKEKFRDASDPDMALDQEFRVMRSNAHPEFFGWSTNPGLIHRDLYRQYAPFRRLMHDQMSELIKREGRVVTFLLPGVARHIGHGRNVTDPTMPARPKSRLGKWIRGIKKKLYYTGLRKEPF